ncbi:acyl-[acyl-carrier-protein] desaturase [Candidatus Planktophila limnetica]|jgi:acyl-[acyl-carrier-protein] desaturase|uniref:Acyl-[acyl-carrier-protein] desaturase n=1 Tax=Candidatus Planktophila limnetica TaxID=573600 RepID=A0A249LFA3_9ACTN|nr:acyl-ACP desaturase [Candidatus Planktophila limnetica]ASY27565.1 acyl-[acyl-carrier-protein] desaturase [Candidatus Planktophila limnetica]
MSEESASIQSRLIRDLEPIVAVELERHLAIQKNWYPHEYVPWSEGRDFAGPLNGDAWEAKDSRLSSVAQDSLILNLLTEDNLPSYHTEITLSMGRDGAWGNWIERWTAEEGRHAIVIRDYLMATRGVDPYELEDLRMAHMSLGYQTPYENDMLHTIAYVSFQELATRISHRNTGKISEDPIAEGMMQRIALDENLHMIFYRNTLKAALDLEPNAAMRAIADVVTNFDMPGANMPGFGRKAVQIALAGIYDMQQHLEEVIAPVLRAWEVFERNDLSGDGLVARDELNAFLTKTTEESNRFNEKREHHFERLIARGQEPIRIQK